MAHAQQQILEAVRSILATGATAAGSNVYLDRVDAVPPNLLPAILVDESAEGETVTLNTMASIEERALGVSITCVAAHGTEAVARSRDLGLQVEKLLAASATLRSLCKLGVQITGSRPVVSEDKDRLIASRAQDWRMTYMVAAEAPDQIL
jgi:hypothetical protein